MMKNHALSRPATSAIAAFLVLSTPAAFAQEAPVVPMTPPVALPEPSAPPTVAQPAPAPEAAAPQPVIRVPLDLAPETAEPAPEATPRAEVPVRASRPAPRPAASERAADPAPASTPAIAATAPAAAIAAADGPLIDATMAAAPAAAPEPALEAAPAPVEQNAPAGDGFPWEIVGGAAALLIAGGAGLAFARRRRAGRDDWNVSDADPSPEYVPTGPTVTREEEAVIAPQPEPARQPIHATTPTFAAAPHGSMGRHEAMAMAGPTPDNPFVTLSKRLARARFLDRQERAEYDATLAAQKNLTAPAEPARKPVSAWELSQRPAPAPATEQEVRRLQPGRVRVDLKPGWTRN